MKLSLTLYLNLLAILLALPSTTLALAPGDKVENFRLLDHTGKSFELHYQRDTKLIALMVQGVGCPIVRNASHTYKSLRDQYQHKGVAFFMLNANLQDNRKAITKEANEFAIDFPILIDDTQLIAESLSLERTAEVLLIDTSDWTLVYRGAIDNRLGYETQRTTATEHYLADAIEAKLNNKAVGLASTPTQGCLMNIPGPTLTDAQSNHYADEVAPILLNNCVSCHREGGIGPFAMNNYETVRGFAPMIREVIRTKRMPPWHADPHINDFSNDRSLSINEAQTLVHWIENGSPRGKGPDPLAGYQPSASEWLLGQPDLVIEIPPFDVPATGVVDYQFIRLQNPLDKDVWVHGAEILPGSRKVVHHSIVNFGHESDKAPNNFRSLGRIGGYVPGRVDAAYPENTGVLLPKNTTIEFEMHYTTYGKQETDITRLGLYFQDAAPQHEYKSVGIANPRIKIPPHTKEHWESGSWTTEEDVLVYSLMPHAHFRGKAAKFIAHYPSGEQEVLLSVPNYDFNWQTSYDFNQPKRLPAGTRIEQQVAWDNSTLNPANPDPSKEIRWGRQSWDEMLYGVISYRAINKKE